MRVESAAGLQQWVPQVRRKPVPGYGFELLESLQSTQKLGEILDTDSLYADLLRSGVAIYRGFSDSLDDFSRLVGEHSARVTFDPARKTATDNTAEIDAGHLEMGLHRENGNLPYAPDLQWFYCLTPAATGSQTTFCDGARVLYELSGPTRRLFERRRVRFSRRIPWENVQRFLSIEHAVPVAQVDDSHLARVNAQVAGQTYRRLDPHLVDSELVTSAITTSAFSARRAFCNSMLGPSFNYEPPRITWECGAEIDFDLWDEIKDATARCTYELFWEQGDMVVVDNARAMHGRRRLLDRNRRIFGAQSYRKGGAA